MDQAKKIFDHFICFLKWFLSLFVFISYAYFVFHCLSMFCVEKQVSEFLATHSRDLQVARLKLRVLATCFGDLPVARPSCEFIQKLFVTHSRLASREIPRNSFLKCFFHGKLVLNLSHPLLNSSLNIFTSKPNHFEWFFIPLTSLR